MKDFANFTLEVMNAFQAKGLIVARFDHTGRIEYQQDFGYQDITTYERIDGDTLFGIASLTKSFTALAIMQLVQQGRIDLDDDVALHIEELRSYRIPNMKIKHLLTHTTGFFPQRRTTIQDIIGNDRMLDPATNVHLAKQATTKIIEQLAESTTYCGQPGERLSYSNDGYGLLSEIVRRAGHCETYAEYVQRYLFDSLALKRTTLAFNELKTAENVATLYVNEGNTCRANKNFDENAFALMGGGAIKATLNDLISYVCMYLNQGKTLTQQQVLTPELLREMMTSHVSYNQSTGYGYGLSVQQLSEDTVVGHGGSLPGVSSHMLWSMEQQIGVVVLCNTADVPVHLIAQKLLRSTPESSIQPLLPSRVSADNFDDSLLGRYRADEGQVVEVIRKRDQFHIRIGVATYLGYLIAPTMLCIPQKYHPIVLEFHLSTSHHPVCVRLGGRLIAQQK